MKTLARYYVLLILLATSLISSQSFAQITPPYPFVDTGTEIKLRNSGAREFVINTEFRINNIGQIISGEWLGLPIAPAFGGIGINTSVSSGLPSIVTGVWRTTPIDNCDNANSKKLSYNAIDGFLCETSSVGIGTGTVTSIVFTSPLTGGTVVSTGNIGIQDSLADGSTKGAASFAASDFNATAGNITIDYTNAQAASGSLKGFLTAADWTAFAAKGDASTNASSSIVNELSLFADTSGKLLKRATAFSGIPVLTLGVMTTVSNPAGAIVGTFDVQALTFKTIDATLNTISNISETMLAFTDVTTNNFSITKHGLVPKGTNTGTAFLRDDGQWASTTGSGDVSSDTTSSIDLELALFKSTTGKLIKRGIGTGLVKATSGVVSYVAAPTTAVVGIDDSQVLTNKSISGLSNTITNIQETMMSFSDITTLNVSTARHGFVPKAPNTGTQFLRDDGAWATPSGSGDVSSNTATSVDAEIALFNLTTGKSIRRATGSGIAKLTSGVLSVVAAPTGAIMGTTDTQSPTNKTYDTTNIFTIRDDRFTLQDSADLTKQATFQLSGIGTGTSREIILANATGTMLLDTAVQRVTNKRIDPRITIAPNATSITLNFENTDLTTQANTQAAGTLTFNIPIGTGTPAPGQNLSVRYKCSAIQTLSFITTTGGFRSSTDIPFPATCPATNKANYLLFKWNEEVSLWDLMSKIGNF